MLPTIVMAACALVTAALAEGETYKGDVPLRHVVVAPKWVNQAQFAGMFVAIEEGIYKKYGLELEIREYDFERDPVQEVIDKDADFALTTGERLLISKSKNEPIQAVSAIFQTSPYVLISLKEKNIKSAADLDGKTIGNKGGNVEERLFISLILESVGLTEKSVAIKKLGFEKDELQNLLDDDVDIIDIYKTSQLYYFETRGVEYEIIDPERYGFNVYNDILIAHTDLIDRNKDVVRDFVKGTIEGWEFAIKNPEKAVNATMKYVTDPSYNNIAYERYMLEKNIPLIQPEENFRIGSMSHAKWESLYKNMQEKGFLEKCFDIKRAFTTEFIPE